MSTVRISLSRGLSAIIDAGDLPLVGRWNWYANPRRQAGKFYAVSKCGSACTNHYMHRLIIGAGDGDLVDHINSDSLDNRRANLRIANSSQNAINRLVRNAHGFRGICRTRQGAWFGRVTVDGRRYYSAPCRTEAEAARAYDQLALHYHGAFAVLNFADGVGANNPGARGA